MSASERDEKLRQLRVAQREAMLLTRSELADAEKWPPHCWPKWGPIRLSFPEGEFAAESVGENERNPHLGRWSQASAG